ncbi:MAG: hypothetical protein KBD46_03835 [Candidatus Levybacteria bacterium]|nr:hypothetical protein [Candidatus Levybacteria bacterium]
MSKKQLIFFIFVGFVALLMVLLAIILTFAPQSPPSQQTETPQITTQPSTSTTQTGPQTKPAVPYSQTQTDKLLQRVTTRTPLSDADKTVKQTIIASMNAGSESVFVSPQFRIEYIKSPDVFMVEVLDPEVTSAKKAAVDWFLQKGFSIDAVCTMPVTFYLNPAVANQLKNTNTVFSPLAQGC